MGMNKDLPREEQLKIVLKNYDNKVAECNALKQELAKANQKIEQQKILYNNMLARFEGLQRKDKSINIDWQAKYDKLKAKYDKKNKMYSVMERQNSMMKKSFANVLCSITNAYNGVSAVKLKLDEDLEALKDEDIDLNESAEEVDDAPVQVVVAEKEDAPPASYTEYQEKNFIKYVRNICKNFLKTGSLRGISTLARDIGVTALSKEQFFQFGLNTEHLTNDYIINVYKQIKKR